MLMRFDPFRELERLTQQTWERDDCRACPWTPTARVTTPSAAGAR